ncbi:UNVERIFIED_CONTAM: hypothetical protein Slati_3044000 [Sesamum latifolium]|uniref:Uncharacterized protein n=1 Tax=Sesamum latifolium TaxID=2727402 RepID=A0AAW2UW08_9LAMI
MDPCDAPTEAEIEGRQVPPFTPKKATLAQATPSRKGKKQDRNDNPSTPSNEDLLLGSKLHNRSLFVLGFIQEQRVNRILIDGGSAVNIMPKTTMKKLGITSEDLSRSRLTIQGFDQGTQRAVGMTRLDLTVGELKASTLFHVIDARTSYNLLQGRPWLHENGVVPSTLYQCFKYIKNGEIVKVNADMKPFTEAESYFADAKLYLDPDNMQEVLPSRFSVGYSSEEVYPKATPIENNNEKLSETAKDEAPTNEKHEVKKPPYSLKESNSKRRKVRDLQEIKAELVTPITGLHPLISSDSPIPKDQHRNMQGAFSHKAYHLLAKSGYDFSAPSRLNKLNPKLIGEKIHGLTKAQHKLRKQELEDGVQATVDELKELNLGTTEEPRPIFVSALLSPEEEEKYFKTLGEYKDVFACTYKEIPGLDPKVAIHHHGIRHGARPVKQSQRVLRPDLIPRIETEVNKLIDVGFIKEVKYPTWISSIVPVKKNNGQIRICVDFRDLTKHARKMTFLCLISNSWLMRLPDMKHCLSWMDHPVQPNQNVAQR